MKKNLAGAGIQRRECEQMRRNPEKNPITCKKINPLAKNGIFTKLSKECLEKYNIKVGTKARMDVCKIVDKNERKFIEKRVLKPYQQKVVDFMKHNRAILMAHSTGAGKTFTAVNVIVSSREERPDAPIIIIAPLSVIENWKRELCLAGIFEAALISFNNFLNNPMMIDTLCSNAIVVIDEVHNLRTKVTTLNNNHKLMAEYTEKTGVTNKVDIPDIIKYKPKKGSISYYNIACAMKGWKVILLTATPLVNTFDDMKNIFTMLGVRIPKGKKGATTVTEENIASLVKVMPVSYVNIKKNHENGYPNYSMKEYIIQLNDKQRAKYDKFLHEGFLNDDIFNKIDTDMLMIELNFLRRAAITGFDAYLSPKIEAIKQIMLKNKRKTLLYTVWIEHGIKKVIKILNIPGLKVSVIQGSVSKSERQKIVDEFNKDESFKILIITSAGREGIDLKGVRDVFLVEPGWNGTSEHQALSRAVRFGSHLHLPVAQQTVDIYRMLLEDSVDTELHNHYVKHKSYKADKLDALLKKYSI